MFNSKVDNTFKRRRDRVRYRIKTSSNNCPRLSVFRTNKNIYVQLIDDFNNCTLVSASTIEAAFKKKDIPGGNIEAAKHIGKLVAERAVIAGIKKVVFDRGGYLYHGRIKALADSARKYNLVF